MIETLKNSILNSEFDEAKKILLNYNEKEIIDIVSELAYDWDNIGVYFFILDITFKENTAFWHGLASTILTIAFCYIPGAYYIAYKHMEKAIELDPSDISYKEGILLFYYVPDKVLDAKSAYKIAKEILEYDNTNNTAKHLIERIDEQK